jgi:hypothetical protein
MAIDPPTPYVENVVLSPTPVHPPQTSAFGQLSTRLRECVLDVVEAKVDVRNAQVKFEAAKSRYAEAILAFKQGVCKDAGTEWDDR